MLTTVESLRTDAPGGKYRVLAQLGEGGTASVYLAVARGPSGFNKLVVLKTIKPILADDPEFRRMFLQEARVAARLNHPHVVQTYEVVETGGAPIIVMEYLDGEPLSKLLTAAGGDLALNMHLRIIADATSALHYAHEVSDFDGRPLGLVHRDITPHNVFVTFEGQTKILDFGIAKLTTANPETQAGVIKGKLRYMPPEQIVGEHIDRRADIYAIGVMLWEAATGVPMWKGCSDATVMNRVLNGELVRPREVRPQVPARLEAICMKAMANEPDGRYATAAEIEAEIEALIDEMGSRASARVIGKVCSNLFAEAREERKALIEKQLSKVALLSHEEYGAMEASAMPALGGVGQMRAAAEPAPRSKARWVWAFVAFGVLGLLGITAAASRRPAAAPTPAASGTTDGIATHSPASASASPIATAAIRVSASPAEAELRIDGQLLPTNPFVRTLPADGSQHTLTAQAPGYDTNRLTFSADHDEDLSLILDCAKPAPNDKPRARPEPTPNGATPSTGTVRPAASTPGPNCNPPYRIDSAGIKTFKLECL